MDNRQKINSQKQNSKTSPPTNETTFNFMHACWAASSHAPDAELLPRAPLCGEQACPPGWRGGEVRCGDL